jgi:RNA polymerase sigma factor for flagellar operon FliA
MVEHTVSRNDPRLSRLLEQVRRIARAIARSLPPSVQLDDLVAAGNLGLATAIARFTGDPAAFEPFAIVHARGAMLDELRRLDTMSRLGRLRAHRALSASRRLTMRLGRNPDDAEIAAELGIELEAYHDVVLQRAATNVDILDHDRLEGSDTPADEEIDARRARRRVSDVVAQLPTRHATVIALSFAQDETLGSIAKNLGVSVARAHQIRADAIQKLRRSYASLCELPGSSPPARERGTVANNAA